MHSLTLFICGYIIFIITIIIFAGSYHLMHIDISADWPNGKFVPTIIL